MSRKRNKQYSYPQKTYSDKPYETEAMCFAKDTKSRKDKNDTVSEIENTLTSNTEEKIPNLLI